MGGQRVIVFQTGTQKERETQWTVQKERERRKERSRKVIIEKENERKKMEERKMIEKIRKRNAENMSDEMKRTKINNTGQEKRQ